MISLRSHVLSVLAAVMALAVGVALGSGPLSHDLETRPAASSDPDDLRAAQARAQAAEDGTRSSDAFVDSLSDQLVRGRLTDRAVTLLVLPGAAPATVGALRDTVGRAGGRVVGEVRLDEGLLDVAGRQLVGELGSQMLASVEGARRGGVAVPDGAGDYERLGRLLARALLTEDREGAEVDAPARGIIAGLETSGLVEVLDGADVRGSLLLAVAGAPYGGSDEREGAGIIASTLLTEAARTARAVVLAGPSASDGADGLVGSLRRTPVARERVSTVDGADTAAGRVTAVLALAADVRGSSGHYGVGPDADAVRPPDPR